MNNEEKILELLEQMNGRLDKMDGRLDKLEKDVVALKENVEVIKEDTEITRYATNTLLDWAEQRQIEVKIPLYKREA